MQCRVTQVHADLVQGECERRALEMKNASSISNFDENGDNVSETAVLINLSPCD
jgi:hypothetical protein